MKDFDANLKKQFKELKALNPDEPKHLEHLYADFVELVTLFAAAGSFVSTADILDRLKDEGAIVTDDDMEDADQAEENDKQEAWVDEIFRVLEQRSNTYGNDYPFDLSHRRITLADKLTFKNKLYLFLLASANLKIFKAVKSSLTSDFEAVSFYALSNYLSDRAIVKQFGKQSDYIGTAREKITKLAEDLKVELNQMELDNVSEQNKMERGLDVIGWLPFEDGCPNMITILGQCACGRDWHLKYHDTKRFENYLSFYKKNPIHAMFIPYALVGKQQGRTFYRSDDIEKDTMLFERKRITELFSEEEFFNTLESKSVVDQCLLFTEDIV
ncbi:hypothetical protein [Pedobacter rhizosphaerae]|uniref:Uncharacterized protein n=1 Tax=Pedobacter rhizosphaerae TaxID=390241 RepID=A0A1H9T2W8_9SPHI|nr:hypothetical protein [Pedobacter rhizosphaerae]SER91344.1 hypothetical protein SAMN04488023_12059 [Pedobacter rhizosphaerae]